MNSEDLTHEQAAALAEQIRQRLYYITLLLERMERQQWQRDAELLVVVRETHAKLHRHYGLGHSLTVRLRQE